MNNSLPRWIRLPRDMARPARHLARREECLLQDCCARSFLAMLYMTSASSCLSTSNLFTTNHPSKSAHSPVSLKRKINHLQAIKRSLSNPHSEDTQLYSQHGQTQPEQDKLTERSSTHKQLHHITPKYPTTSMQANRMPVRESQRPGLSNSGLHHTDHTGIIPAHNDIATLAHHSCHPHTRYATKNP